MNRDSDKYRLLIENLPDAFAYHQVVTDDDGKPVDYIFLEVNAAFEEMTGLKKAEVIGKKVTEVHPDITESAFDWIGAYGQVAQDGEVLRFEHYFEPSKRWYEVCAYSNEPGYFAVVFRDISAQKENESNLQRSEKSYKNLTNSIPEMVVHFDAELRHIYGNQVVEQFLGIPADFFTGKTFLDLLEWGISEDQANQLQAMHTTLEKCLQSGEEQHFIDSFNLPEEKKHLFTRIVPERAEDGDIVTLLAVTTDITEFKQAEEALQEQRNLLKGIFQSIQDGISVLNPDLTIREVNQTMEKWYSHEMPLVGKKCYEVYQNRSAPCDKCPSIKALEQKTVCSEVVPFMGDDGHVGWIELFSYPLVDEATNNISGVVEFVRDITERKKIEKTLELQARERAAVDTFTYSVSNDLQAPLRRIEGFSEALLEECAGQLNNQSQDYLNRIITQVGSMKNLTDALLQLSRVVSREIVREKVDLSALAHSNLEKLQHKEPGRQLESVVKPGLIAEGDSELLKLMLANLLDNAWKFTSGVEEACVELGSTAQDGRTVYYLKDNGVGFDMCYSDKLFAPFQRLHCEDVYPGIGIGLNLVYRIISRHDGEIWAEGESGKGACFYFTLP